MLMVEFLEWNHAWYLLKGAYFWQFLAKYLVVAPFEF